MYTLMLFSYFLFLYFVFFKERVFDFLTLYAILLSLYNLPTLLGIVYEPYARSYEVVSDPLMFSTALIFVSSIPFFIVKSPSLEFHRIRINKAELRVDIVLFFILTVYSIVFIYYLPSILNSSSKRELMESGANIYAFLGMLPVLGFFISYKSKKNLYALLFLALTLVVFILGSRRPFAILFLGFFIFLFSGRKVLPLTYVKMFAVGLLGLAVVVLGKSFYSFFLLYGYEGIPLWIENFNFSYFLSGSEFMGRSSILNAIIENSFTVDTMHILKSILAIQPVPMSYFGYSSSAFNEQFQSLLFNDLDYGMAYNPWAEAYAWLGYLGLVLYSWFICLSLSILWRLYVKKGVLYSSLVLLVSLLVAFWVHRNSLGSELAYIRNAIYPALFFYFIGYVCYFSFLRLEVIKK